MERDRLHALIQKALEECENQEVKPAQHTTTGWHALLTLALTLAYVSTLFTALGKLEPYIRAATERIVEILMAARAGL